MRKILPMLFYDMVYQKTWGMVLGTGVAAGIAIYEAGVLHGIEEVSGAESVSYTHLDVYKRQAEKELKMKLR